MGITISGAEGGELKIVREGEAKGNSERFADKSRSASSALVFRSKPLSPISPEGSSGLQTSSQPRPRGHNRFENARPLGTRLASLRWLSCLLC